MKSSSRTANRTRSGNMKPGRGWMFALAVLVLGVVLGYLFRGSSSQTASAGSSNGNQTVGSSSPTGSGLPLEVAVQPLLERLKDNPSDPELLANIGNQYYDHQDYGKAVDYYEKSLTIRPEDVNVRTDMGTAIWYAGNPERAIQEYETSLKYQPNHAQTLFNMGIVKWQGEHDGRAALESWQKLLAADPEYPDRQKVEQLMQQVQTEVNQKTGTPTGQ